MQEELAITSQYVMAMHLKFYHSLRLLQEVFRPTHIGGNDQMTGQHGLILQEQLHQETHIHLRFLEEMRGSDAGSLMRRMFRNIPMLWQSPSVRV